MKINIKNYIAKLPNHDKTKELPLITLPHYLAPRLLDLLREV